jgi:hypothetical protein
MCSFSSGERSGQMYIDLYLVRSFRYLAFRGIWWAALEFALVSLTGRQTGLLWLSLLLGPIRIIETWGFSSIHIMLLNTWAVVFHTIFKKTELKWKSYGAFCKAHKQNWWSHQQCDKIGQSGNLWGSCSTCHVSSYLLMRSPIIWSVKSHFS